MLSWLIFGVSIQDILNFSLIIALVIGVILLLVKVPGSRMIIAGVFVLLIAASGVFSGIKLNEYYNAEGGIFGKIDDIINPNKVEISNQATSIDFDFSQVVLTGTDDTSYSAKFTSEEVLTLDSNSNYKVFVNGSPCKIIDYTSSSLVCKYNYVFYGSEGNVILEDELSFTFGFNKYSTDLIVYTKGNSEAVALWNSYFDKNQFKVTVTSTDDLYVSDTKTASLTIKKGNAILKYLNLPVGTKYTLETLEDTDNYKFMGYSYNGTDIISETEITVNFNRTIYAIFEEKHLVYFCFELSDKVSAYSAQYVIGEKIADKLPAKFTKAGYDLVGWSIDGKNLIDLDTTLYDGTYYKIYAIWKVQGIPVSVVLNGGSVNFNGQKYTSDFTFTIKSDETFTFTNPQKDSKVFNHYTINFTCSENTTGYYYGYHPIESVFSSGVTLNDLFESAYYYDDSGLDLFPSIDPELDDSYIILHSYESVVITLNFKADYTEDFSVLSDYDLKFYISPHWLNDNPSYSNDVFIVNWLENTGLDTSNYTLDEMILLIYRLEIAINVTELPEGYTARNLLEDVYLKYYYQDNPDNITTYVVKFMVDDEEYNSQEINKNTYISLPTEPTKTSYEFLGWSINGIDIVENIQTSRVTEDVTYIAVFECNESGFIPDENIPSEPNL